MLLFLFPNNWEATNHERKGPMAYLGIINVDKELKKAARGRATKVPVGVVLYNALQDYPHIQALIAQAFEIETVNAK